MNHETQSVLRGASLTAQLPKEQPTREEKLRVLRGETGFNSGDWNFQFAAPPVHHNFWGPSDWIKYIGDNWFRIP